MAIPALGLVSSCRGGFRYGILSLLCTIPITAAVDQLAILHKEKLSLPSTELRRRERRPPLVLSFLTGAIKFLQGTCLASSRSVGRESGELTVPSALSHAGRSPQAQCNFCCSPSADKGRSLVVPEPCNSALVLQDPSRPGPKTHMSAKLRGLSGCSNVLTGATLPFFASPTSETKRSQLLPLPKPRQPPPALVPLESGKDAQRPVAQTWHGVCLFGGSSTEASGAPSL